MLAQVATQMLSPVLNLPPLIYVVVMLASVWYLRSRSRLPDNVPPFPVRPYPLVGHLPMLGKNPMVKIKEWHRTTGDMFSILMGQKLNVFLNSFDLIREALVKNGDNFSDRPHRIVSTDQEFFGGIVDTSGPLWKEQRTVSTTILKSFGLGKNWIGEKISIEVTAYLDALSKLKGQPADVNIMTYGCVANVISTILVGERFEHEDPEFEMLLSRLSEQVRLLPNISVSVGLPWLKYLPGDLCKIKKMTEINREFRELYSAKYIKRFKESLNTDPGQNFITDYLLEESKKKNSGRPTTLDEDHLTLVISNLFQAGTETTSTTMQWMLLFALHHQDIQEKMYQEIVEVVGLDRLPSMEDKPKMNYVNAFIMESQRMGNIGPLGLPHLCSKTTSIGGYTIPEGSVIMTNLTAVLNDPKTWGDPSVFRPQRFLDKDDNLVVPEEFIPFGIGRRHCLGDSMAKTELFLFLTGIVQRFQIRPEVPDILPTLEPVFGLTLSPTNYKLRMIERKS